MKKFIFNLSIVVFLMGCVGIGLVSAQSTTVPTTAALVVPPDCPDTPARASSVPLTEAYTATVNAQSVTIQYPKDWVAEGGGDLSIKVATNQATLDALASGKPLATGSVALQIQYSAPPSLEADADPVQFLNDQPVPPGNVAAFSTAIPLQLGGLRVACTRFVGNGSNPNDDAIGYFFVSNKVLYVVLAITAKGEFETQRPLIEAIVASFASQYGTPSSGETTEVTSEPAAETSDTSATPQPIEYNQTIKGSLQTGESTTYEFDGQKGNLIILRLDNINVCYQLTAPKSYQFNADADGDVFNGLTLPFNGTYTLTLENTTGAGSDYSFMVLHDMATELALKGKLGIGGMAAVYTEDDGLKLRAKAGTHNPIVETLPSGTTVEILGGPVQAEGYTWWNIRAPSGNEGWSVSSADNIDTLTPVGPDLTNGGFEPPIECEEGRG